MNIIVAVDKNWAIGKDNKAKYASTAIGHTNDANGYYTATMGVNNTARADESTAIGYGNSVDGQQNGGTTPKAAYTMYWVPIIP